MKKITEKLFVGMIAILAVVRILSLSIEVKAAEVVDSGTCGENLTWTLDSHGWLCVSGTGSMDNYDKGAAPWYDYRKMIEVVQIEYDVTSVGDYAFYDCNIRNLFFWDVVVYIGKGAFLDSGLTSVDLPNGLISIGDYAFSGCCFDSISIPCSVEYIGAFAFKVRNCISVSSSNPFYSSDEYGVLFNKDNSLLIQAPCFLQGYSIPDSVITIGDYAFSDNPYLLGVDIPTSVSAIGAHAFESCIELTPPRIPNGVVAIGDYAFAGCGSLFPDDYLSSLVLPDTLISIGKYAFSRCVDIERVFLPDSVANIGEGVFSGCYNLSEIVVDESNSYYFSDSYGVLFNSAKMKLIQAPSLSGYYEIPDGITEIGKNAFPNYDELSIGIPDSVVSIECSLSGLSHVFVEGSESYWEDTDVLWSTSTHFDSMPKRHKNCENAGWYCVECDVFITKERLDDGTHSYTDISDIICNDCDYTQKLVSISIYKNPNYLEFEMFDGVLDIAGGVIQLNYNDGGQLKIDMTNDMVSGFDNTKIGAQTLRVTYEGKTTTYTVEIVPGTPNGIEIWTMPKTLDYITGAQLDLTGLSLLAYYPGDLTAEIPLADITVDSVDMSTPGIKTVRVGYKGVYTSFSIYVHTKQTVTLDSTTYPESSHNYASNTNESKTFTYPGAGGLVLTFNSSSYTESNYDWVYLYDGAGNQIGKYSGSLAGKVVTIPSDTFTIKLTSDSSVNKYGYAFSSIVAETILHTYENNICTICGQFEHGLVLTQDMVINETLDCDLYIDLNGYDLSGTIVTNGYNIYGMDSATNSYTCDTIGTFSCVDESGNAIVPESLYTHADAKRYMTIATDSGYTFHRFYLGITNISLAPSVTGFGYKAEFYGDEMLQSQIESIGYNLWLTEDRVVSRTAGFKNSLTLRLKNFDVANYGNVPVNACVTITLTDGTVITGAPHSHTLQQALETVNSHYADFTASQLAAVSAMIEANPVMQTWQVENIYKKEI